MKNTFVISCPIDTYSGYGSRSRDFVKAIVELDKYNVKILSQRWGNCAWNFIDDHYEEWGFLKSLIINNMEQQPDIWCQITVPNEFQRVGKYNIGVTAGIETTVCAHQWIQGLNRMDLNLVSSEHAKKVFEDTKYEEKNKQGQVVKIHKIEKPIKVLMEGANLDIFKPIPKKEITNLDLFDDINSIPEDFAFLFVGHWMNGDIGEDRKNVGLLVKLFYEMYKNRKKVPALILKTSVVNSSILGKTELLRRLDQIRKSVDAPKLPNVYIVSGDFNDKEINELYNHPKIKAMISLTKGEGFGRPLLEFSLTNKPVIASAWSGQCDFLNPEFTALVGGSLKEVHKSAIVKDIIMENSKWFNPDLQSGSSLINDVFENYKQWKVKAKRQGYYSRSNFSFNNMKNILGSILEDFIPEIAKEVKLKLPKLKKVGTDLTSSPPKLKLPKLKKVTNG
jgi:hypothetical protein